MRHYRGIGTGFAAEVYLPLTLIRIHPPYLASMNKIVFPLLSFLCLLLTACPPAPQDTLPAVSRTDATTPPSNSDTTPVPTAIGTPATPQVETVAKARRPKNIILMIGDGMGITQISAGMYSNNNQLNLEQFPVIGLHKSYSGDNLVTDSAAGATAFSAGVKTYNGAIGVGMDTLPVVTILELAEAAGLPTGLVATCSIVHATPASFVAHNRQRKNYEEIATDFLKTEVDLLIGGGAKFFDRRKNDESGTIKPYSKQALTVSSSTNIARPSV